jgi:signal transduction histidine kinase
MRNFLIFIFLFLSPLAVWAQSDISITSYQVEQGLPTNLTKAIIKDNYGFMWIGTDNGLLRYDGNQFISYKNALPSNYIKAFLTRRNGDLLVAHDMGISLIENKIDTVQFQTYLQGTTILTDTTVFFPKTLSLYEDYHENLWISEPQSIVKITNGKIKRYHFPESEKTSSFLRSFIFEEDGFGNFIVGSQPGSLFYYSYETDSFSPLDIKVRNIHALQKIEKGKIWVASSDGIYELIIDSRHKVVNFQHLIQGLNISCLTMGKNGEILAGSWYTGLYKIIKTKAGFQPLALHNVNLKTINHILFADRQQIWLCSDDGLALLQYSHFSRIETLTKRSYFLSLTPGPDGKIFTTEGSVIAELYEEDAQIQQKQIFFMENHETINSLTSARNKVWFGTSQGNLYFLNGNKAKPFQLPNASGSIFYMFTDSEDNIWICQQTYPYLHRIAPNNEITSFGKEKGILNPIHIIKESPSGELFCAGAGKDTYLYQYDQYSDTFKNISISLPLESQTLFTIDDFQFANNKLWLASNHGLLYYHSHKIKQVPLIPNNPMMAIKAISVNKKNQLWLGTDMGILKYLPDNDVVISSYKGFSSKTIIYRGIINDTNDYLWVGTADGVCYTQLPNQEIRITPTPVFLSLTINGQKVRKEQTRFKNNSFLQAEVVALGYPAENITYQYKLTGIHQDWQKLKNNEELIIPQILNGQYTLEVRALQQGEFLWSDPLRYSFTITAPWYLSWWAFLSYFGLLVFIIWCTIKLNTHRHQLEKLRLEKIIQERTEEIYRKNKELEELNITKNKFFSIVAHDLRGPLATLFNFSQLLATSSETFSPNEIKLVAQDLHKSVNNTLQLTENLLTWARAQMENLNYEPEIFLLKKIIKPTIEVLLPIANNKKIQIIFQQENEHTQVFADQEQMKFILRNLISNAIKFTKENGKIEVAIHTQESYALLSVKDSGVGMSKEVCEKIFKLDAKISTPGTSGEKGTGLGLVLCHDFAIKNNGFIEVTSSPGIGSTFIIHIPLKKYTTVKA